MVTAINTQFPNLALAPEPTLEVFRFHSEIISAGVNLLMKSLGFSLRSGCVNKLKSMLTISWILNCPPVQHVSLFIFFLRFTLEQTSDVSLWRIFQFRQQTWLCVLQTPLFPTQLKIYCLIFPLFQSPHIPPLSLNINPFWQSTPVRQILLSTLYLPGCLASSHL